MEKDELRSDSPEEHSDTKHVVINGQVPTPHETDFIVGDVYNNPFLGTLSTFADIGSAIEQEDEDELRDADLHYNFAILNIPASLIVFDLIELFRSIPGFSSLSFPNVKSANDTSTSESPSTAFRMLKVQMGMQLDEPVREMQNVDRYFALVCIHVDRARLQNRRKGDSQLTVREIGDMLMSSIRSAVDSQELLLTKGVCGTPHEVSVELAVNCRQTDENRQIESEAIDTIRYGECFIRMIELLSGTSAGICEDSSCPICLEPYGSSEIITFVCSHSFHFHCIGQHILARCPLCRLPIPVPYVRDCYHNQTSSEHRCSECGRPDDSTAHLLLCLACGYVACPVHSLNHFESTSHGYGIELWRGSGETFTGSSRGLPTSRGQRIWNHGTNCWVQQLVSSSNGMQFVELVSNSKPQPEQDPDCCQQLNVLCAQFMRALSHSIDSKAELFQQRVTAIKNEHAARMKSLGEEADALRSSLAEYESARAEIEKRIIDVGLQLSEVKEANSATQNSLKLLKEQVKRCDRELCTVRHAVESQKQTMSDLAFHASARSRIVEASDGRINCEEELEGGDINVRDAVPKEATKPRRRKR